MGLLDTLNELKDTADEVVIEDGKATDIEQEEPKKEELVEEAAEQDDSASEQENAEKEEPHDDKKDKVSNYQRRRTKEFEDQLSKANEEREYFRKQNEEMQKLLTQLVGSQSQIKSEENPQEKQIDPNVDPEAWLIDNIQRGQKGQQELSETIKQLQFQMTLNSAKQELSGMESEFAKANNDYYDVVNHAFEREVTKQKYLNPDLSEQAIRAQLETEKVQLAARFAQSGQNPVDAMYNYMVSVYGKPQKQEPQAEKQKVDTFEAIKKNKAKSATPLAAGGRGSSGNALTKEAAQNMSLAEFARLSAEDKSKIYNNG